MTYKEYLEHEFETVGGVTTIGYYSDVYITGEESINNIIEEFVNDINIKYDCVFADVETDPIPDDKITIIRDFHKMGSGFANMRKILHSLSGKNVILFSPVYDSHMGEMIFFGGNEIKYKSNSVKLIIESIDDKGNKKYHLENVKGLKVSEKEDIDISHLNKQYHREKRLREILSK